MSIRYYDDEEIYLELARMQRKGLAYLRAGVQRRPEHAVVGGSEPAPPQPEWKLTHKGRLYAMKKKLNPEKAAEVAAYRCGWFNYFAPLLTKYE